MDTQPVRMAAPFLHVNVLRVGNHFKWTVREEGGKVISSAVESYETDSAAFRAGNAAARAIREARRKAAAPGLRGPAALA